MKKNLFFAALASALMMVGCTDVELTERVNKLEDRVASVEETLNKTVSDVAALLAAQNTGVTITDVTEITDGIRVTLSTGKVIEITNGENGTTPAIGVKDVDGALYWTVNGELLKDASGNNVKATGDTPSFKIEDGKWYVSVNGGSSWTEVGAAVTETTSPIKDVTVTEDSVTFVLDGASVTLPRNSAIALTIDCETSVMQEASSLTVNYTVAGGSDEVVVLAYATNPAWKVAVKAASASAGQVVISDITETGYVVIEAVDNAKTGANATKKVIYIEANVFEMVSDVAFPAVAAAGATLDITFSTNMDVTAEPAVDWISPVTTKAVVEKTLTVEVNGNYTGATRNGSVKLVSGEKVLATISVTQESAAPLMKEYTEAMYAGKVAPIEFNTDDYAEATDITWTSVATGATSTGATCGVAPEISQTLADATAGVAMPTKAAITVTATLNGKTVSQTKEFDVNVFWMVVPIDTWGRNCNPVFNKECTKVYFETRDGKASGRMLVQVDLVNKTVKQLDLKMEETTIKTDNGGCFSVNPINGNIYCCNNQAVYCINENLEKVWKFAVPGTTTTSNASVLAGNGVALSNNARYIFIATTTNKFYALDAETGNKLSELDFSDNNTYVNRLAQAEFVVCKDDLIILHRNYNQKSALWISFNGTDLKIEQCCNSVTGNTSDITSPCVNADQSQVYFPCNSCVTYLPTAIAPADALHLAGAATGLAGHWNAALDKDGYMYTGVAAKSYICRIDPFTKTFKANILGFDSAANLRNFDNISFDEDNNIYFGIKENSKAYRMCRGTVNANGECAFEVIGNCPINSDWFQGSQNMGDGYMVACVRDSESPKIYVRAIDAKRGAWWSGMGGDVCATRNANFVYNVAK